MYVQVRFVFFSKNFSFLVAFPFISTDNALCNSQLETKTNTNIQGFSDPSKIQAPPGLYDSKIVFAEVKYDFLSGLSFNSVTISQESKNWNDAKKACQNGNFFNCVVSHN